jgi:hypothetical protein
MGSLREGESAGISLCKSMLANALRANGRRDIIVKNTDMFK